jgi:hypothetical protein
VLLIAAGSMLVVTRIVAGILAPLATLSIDTLTIAGVAIFAAVFAWQTFWRKPLPAPRPS